MIQLSPEGCSVTVVCAGARPQMAKKDRMATMTRMQTSTSGRFAPTTLRSACLLRDGVFMMFRDRHRTRDDAATRRIARRTTALPERRGQVDKSRLLRAR